MDITQTKRSDSYAIEFSMKDGANTVGFVFLVVIQNNIHKEPYGLLENLFVEPEYRGKGYGTAVVKAAITKAKELGCYKIIAQSRHGRDALHDVYKKYGFADHGINFRMDLIDSPVIQQE
jgi:GNAT superfamily N-acetyltransferase